MLYLKFVYYLKSLIVKVEGRLSFNYLKSAQSNALFKASSYFCRSPTALKKPDRSKQCHCLPFTQRASLAVVLLYSITFLHSAYRLRSKLD